MRLPTTSMASAVCRAAVGVAPRTSCTRETFSELWAAAGAPADERRRGVRDPAAPAARRWPATPCNARRPPLDRRDPLRWRQCCHGRWRDCAANRDLTDRLPLGDRGYRRRGDSCPARPADRRGQAAYRRSFHGRWTGHAASRCCRVRYRSGVRECLRTASGRVSLKLCQPDGTAAGRLFTRRDGAVYNAARRVGWGDRIGQTHEVEP